MSVSLRLELNHGGFATIGKSEAMRSLLESHGEPIRERCGDGYVMETKQSKYQDGRYVCVVRPGDESALIDEAENKTLEKAVNG